jgi:hypothetical protein
VLKRVFQIRCLEVALENRQSAAIQEQLKQLVPEFNTADE